MKLYFGQFVVTLSLLGALAACNAEPEGGPVLRTEIGSGIAEKTSTNGASARESVCREVTFEQVPLTHCIADPRKHRITTALGGKDNKPYRSLANLAGKRSPNANVIAFAVNGGMFDSDGKPIGYYVENGARLKELSRTDGPGNFHLKPNGVFYGTAGKWNIQTADDFYSNVSDRPQFGTQSGPMLVIDGQLHPEIAQDGPSKAIRNGIGIDKQGKAHFVIADRPLSFGILARFYRDELKTPNALFLDGNVSALWDPANDRLDLGAPLGPLIVVENQE